MASTGILNAGSGFFFWVIAARLFTVEQVGFAAALISSLGLVLLFSRFGFDFSIIRFFALENNERIVNTCLTVTTISCFLVGIIYILLSKFMVPSMFLHDSAIYAMTFLLISIANSVACMTGDVFVANRKADLYFTQNFFIVFRIVPLVPFVFLGTFGIFMSLGLGYLTAALFGLVALRRYFVGIHFDMDLDFVRRSFRFSSSNYLASIMSAAPTLIIPIMVLNMLGEAEAAKYYIVLSISNLVLIIPNSLGTSLFVECSHGERLGNNVLRAGAVTIALLVPAVIMLLLIGDKLLGLLKGEYVEAFGLLRLITLSSFPIAIYSLFIPIQNVRMRVESIVMLNALRCALLLGLSYMFIYQYGILGAGYALITTYTIVMLAIGWIMLKEGWLNSYKTPMT